MAWIESHTVLISHRKLFECARDLRLKPVYLLGHLHALWHVALEQAEDGDLTQWSDEFIAESACYPGDAPQFVSLLQNHGWLDGKLIHDWLDYAGRYLDSKYKTSNPDRLKAILEKHKKAKEGGLQFAFSPPKGSPPYLTLPNQTNLKKEKEVIQEGGVGGEEKTKPDGFVAFCKATLEAWNLFCDKHPILPKIRELSPKRRDKLKKRFEQPSFRDFNALLAAFEEQPFLFGENGRSWRADFDWLIENDTNYLKILERKYKNNDAIPVGIQKYLKGGQK